MAEMLSLAVWCAEPRARFDTRKFHLVRRDALHDALDTCEGVHVLDWGRTDDRFSNEIVDLVIEVNGGVTPGGLPNGAPAAVASMAYTRQVLAKNGASAGCVEAVTALLTRLEPKQVAGEIAAVHLHLLNNFVIMLYPAGDVAQGATLRVIAPDDSITDIPYAASETDIAHLS